MLVKKDISVIILTYNESKHLERCIRSLNPVVKDIFIIDSYSTDSTLEIAHKYGAKVFSNGWINYARQFQFGLDNCPITTDWVMRMDADEYLLPELQDEIVNKMDFITQEISGIYIKRRMYFNGKWIKRGGKYPEWLLRIWRKEDGYIEERWMDEHVVLKKGGTLRFNKDLVDENLNNLSWWTDKHNKYSDREILDVLYTKYNMISANQVRPSLLGRQEESKRFFKEIYLKLPLFIRPFLYFFWRYFFKFGFLDGKQGLVWHFLQGFWYRFLVDAKIFEIHSKAKRSGLSIPEVLEVVYGKKE